MGSAGPGGLGRPQLLGGEPESQRVEVAVPARDELDRDRPAVVAVVQGTLIAG